MSIDDENWRQWRQWKDGQGKNQSGKEEAPLASGPQVFTAWMALKAIALIVAAGVLLAALSG